MFICFRIEGVPSHVNKVADGFNNLELINLFNMQINMTDPINMKINLIGPFKGQRFQSPYLFIWPANRRHVCLYDPPNPRTFYCIGTH